MTYDYGCDPHGQVIGRHNLTLVSSPDTWSYASMEMNVHAHTIECNSDYLFLFPFYKL